MTLADAYKEAFSILVKEEIPEQLINKYVEDPNGNFIELQDFCKCNSKIEWMTGLSILDAADMIVWGAKENGNIKISGK